MCGVSAATKNRADRMDKNKSRTDLLAAGRKKLQQFRQKKEIKSSASHGKSSKKYDKAEQADADASSTTLIPTAPPEVTEKETPRADSHTEISDSPVSHSMGAGEPDTSSTQLREDQGQCRKLMFWTQSNLIEAVK